ncbi:alpha/beta-hydrolase N-terminal domain-containing protein [Corynebacterium suedekumii]|nr:alpha/beta-hydrolase N-terminal domain-containing protein [Corynebacterium suedekumii]
MQLTHATLAAITTAAIALSLRRQPEQARLVDLGGRRGARHALIGGVVGTAGYGALLLLGDAAQVSVDRLGARLSRYMPIWVSWPWPPAWSAISRRCSVTGSWSAGPCTRSPATPPSSTGPSSPGR